MLQSRVFWGRYAGRQLSSSIHKSSHNWQPQTLALHADNFCANPDEFSTDSDVAPPISVSTTYAPISDVKVGVSGVSC